MLAGLPAGAWMDRTSRRRALAGADLGRAVVLASVPLAWVAGALTMTQLYLVWVAAAGGLIPLLPLLFSPLRALRDVPEPG